MKIRFPQAVAVAMALALGWPAMGKPIRIATIHGAPWGFIGSDGKPTGMMYEIGNRIAEGAGFSYTNALLPYARTEVDIDSGRADFTLRFGNEHLARVAVPVATIVTMPVVVVGAAGTSYKSLSELRGKSIGVIRTSTYVAQFDADTAIQKYAVNDYPTMARMVVSHRLDAGIGSSVGLYYGAYVAGVKPEELGPPLVLGYNDFILFLSNRSATPATIDALRASVRKLAASGEIKRIIDKYSKDFTTGLP